MFLLQIQVSLEINQLECKYIHFYIFPFFKCIMYVALAAFSCILHTITWIVCISRFNSKKYFSWTSLTIKAIKDIKHIFIWQYVDNLCFFLPFKCLILFLYFILMNIIFLHLHHHCCNYDNFPNVGWIKAFYFISLNSIRFEAFAFRVNFLKYLCCSLMKNGGRKLNARPLRASAPLYCGSSRL